MNTIAIHPTLNMGIVAANKYSNNNYLLLKRSRK